MVRVLTTVLLIFVLLAQAFLLPSCGGGEPELVGRGEVIIDGYYPYISEVRLPSEVYAGEQFFYTFTVEVSGKEYLLNGLEELDLNVRGGMQFDVTTSKYYAIADVMIHGAKQGQPRYEFRSGDEFPVAGEHVIAILSAPTPEQGGMAGKYETVGSPGPRTPGLIYREFPVTVLPARELE